MPRHANPGCHQTSPRHATLPLSFAGRLLTFYDFPAKHWTHIRTSNPIESIFSTVRLRHNKTRNNASRAACLAMIYKLGRVAERGFQRLNGSELLQDVVAGIIYEDGVKKSAA